MTTKRRDTGTVTGGHGRPPMKTSHEKVHAKAGPKGKGRPSVLPVRPRAPSARRRGLPVPARVSAGEHPRAWVKKARATDTRGPGADGSFSIASPSARETAAAVAMAAIDKKASAVEILDVAGKVDYADFLVVMTGGSDRHTQALAQGIEEALEKKGMRALAIEGASQGTWILVDYGDVVVHVFQDEARQLYDIEGLWIDASRIPVPAV
ncbi:MAG: ribosome silencing factor [Polyangiaceae bacterium]